MIQIREAKPHERTTAADVAVAAFAQLGTLLAPDERRRLAERVRATTTDPQPGTVIVAVAGDQVVGSVVYNSPGEGQHPLFAGDWAFFRSIGVDAAYAGQGIGRRLVEACIDRACRDGAAWLGLYAADANTVAVRLYRDMGFRQTGDAPPYWGLTYRIYGLDLSAG
jgi:ribosomal protein S18 acetylase RimI-like enzyme